MEIKREYPQCRKETFCEDYFGHRLEDPYRWLKDAKDPEVLAWVEAQNEYTDSWFGQEELDRKIKELKEQKLTPLYGGIAPWKDRLTASVQEDGDCRVVSVDRGFQGERLIMKRGDVPGFVPFEFHACPADQRFAMITGMFDGAARMSSLIVDCEKREILTRIDDIFSSAWSKKREIVYYAATKTDVAAQTTLTEVYAYHVDTKETRLIHKETANAIIGEIYVSSDGRHIILEMWQDYSYCRFYTYSEETDVVTAVNKEAMQLAYVDSIEGTHYFISKERAGKGEVLAVKDGCDISGAVLACPEKEKVVEDGFVLGGRLYLLYMDKACSELVQIDGGKERVFKLPDDMGTAEYAGRTEDAVYLRFESFLVKPMLLSFDGEKISTVFQNPSEEYGELVVEQRTAPSTGDGKEIPYFMVRRRDASLDGTNSVWIYAYGGYNMSMRPRAKDVITQFDIARWADRGGIYVVASLRGGNEFGTSWHEEGMLMKKKNCYYDFIGITEQLIKEGWTEPSRIVISGASNGGLLMSALVTIRPDLFRCVIASVPHTDMIGFAEDDRGPMYITEYGNPRESKEMFEYLLSYSPYHNVRKEQYPAIYIQTGECDNNVPPYHGKKFAARLQEMSQGGNPVLLRVLEKGSHDRGAGEVFWRTVSEMQLFVEKALGGLPA